MQNLKNRFVLSLLSKQNKEGFTLIELLVVIIIIGVLAAIALPSLINAGREVKASRICIATEVESREIYREQAEVEFQCGPFTMDVKRDQLIQLLGINQQELTVVFLNTNLNLVLDTYSGGQKPENRLEITPKKSSELDFGATEIFAEWDKTPN